MKPKILRIFDCPFYHYKKYIDVKIDRKIRKASLKFSIYKILHETTENHLLNQLLFIIIRLNVKKRKMRKKKEIFMNKTLNKICLNFSILNSNFHVLYNYYKIMTLKR